MKPPSLTGLFASAAIALASQGCASSTVSCDDVCACKGQKGDGACVASCKQAETDAKAQATSTRCDKSYLELTTCESDNSVCDSKTKLYTYPEGVCDPQLKAYEACVAKATGQSGATSSSSSTGTGG
jgi:hypothetical protein